MTRPDFFAISTSRTTKTGQTMSSIKTVYDHIRQNNIKTILLVLLFPLLFLGVIFLFMLIIMDTYTDALAITGTVAIPVLIISAVWMLISWAFGDSMILNVASAHEISPDDKKYREVFRSVENVALSAGLPTPRVYIIEDSSLNAFATGRSPSDASVALTRGIIDKLDSAELAGVISHEMAHIGNRDIRLDMLIITGLGVTVFTADLLLRGAIHSGHTSNNQDNNKTDAIILLLWLAFSVFNLIIAPILQMAISRNREYAADSTGALITRNPTALASALRKISGNSTLAGISKIKTMSSICIAPPTRARAFSDSLMATHPPVQKRIERLESMSIK